MFPIKIALISDLHVGDMARSNDLRLTPDGFKEKYVEDFCQFCQRNNFYFDYLMILGDLTSSAEPKEFKIASDVIVKISEVLNIDFKRLLFVPGNHDSNWNLAEKERRYRYIPLLDEKFIFKNILDKGKKDITKCPYFTYWEFSNALIIGFNSAWHDDSKKENHYGFIKNETINALDEFLANQKKMEDKLKIFLVHHHPVNHPEKVPFIDISEMQNSGNMLSLLYKYNFDVLMHGHKHQPFVTTDIRDDSNSLLIIGSGSFSAYLPSEYSGHINNLFHIITIEGRDSETGTIYGYVENWTYLYGTKWVKSHQNNGIESKVGFGPYIQPKKVKSELETFFKTNLPNHRDNMEWDIILKTFPYLAWMKINTVESIIKSVCESQKIIQYGTIDDKALFKKE